MTENQLIGFAILAISIFVYFTYAKKIQTFLDLQKIKSERNKKKNQAHQTINSISIMLNQIDILDKIKSELGDDIFSSISQTGLNEISTKVEQLKSSSSYEYDNSEPQMEMEETPAPKVSVEETPPTTTTDYSWMNDYNNYKNK